MSDRLFEVGKFVNTHGIKGEIKMISVTDFPEDRFKKGSQLFLSHPSLTQPISVTIDSARLHKNTYIVKFKEYNNINDIEKYKGGSIKVSESERSELEEDEFYYDEIIGCEVWTDEGERLGLIKEILSTGANDVWIVGRDNGKEILLPFIEDCVIDVNTDEKKIKVHVLEGLIE